MILFYNNHEYLVIDIIDLQREGILKNVVFEMIHFAIDRYRPAFILFGAAR